MDDGDPVMEMYKAKAIIIEKEAEIEELRRRIGEFEMERQQRNQGEPCSSSRDLWAAILKLEESNALQKQRVEQSERTLEESMRNIQIRLESAEKTDRFDRIERRLEEIAAMNANIWEKMMLEDRIKEGNETILIMGGGRNYKTSDEMVILDRKTRTWKVLELKLLRKNSYGGSVLLNGEIYIFGGDELKKKLYKLDSQQMKWIKLGEMNEDRQCISNSSLVFQECIWIIGGLKENGEALDTVEKYCPERNEWIKMPGMSEKRSSTTAAVCNEKIFVSGGNKSGTALRTVECFDPTSGVWTPMADLPGIRSGPSMISDGSSLFVMGGRDGNRDYFETVWRIRTSEENAAWEELQPMNVSRSHFTAKSLCCSTPSNKKEIYAIGGWNGQYLDSVEIFDGERWRHGPKLPNECHSMSSLVIPPSLAEILLHC